MSNNSQHGRGDSEGSPNPLHFGIYVNAALILINCTVSLAETDPAIYACVLDNSRICPTLYILWFTEIAFLLELVFPNFKKQTPFNVKAFLCRFLCLLPFLYEILCCFITHSADFQHSPGLRILSSLRLLRLLRLTALHSQYEALVRILNLSGPVLLVGLAALLMAGFVGGVLTFYVENLTSRFDSFSSSWNGTNVVGESFSTPYQSIFDGVYWVVSTLCTVGYGDLVPRTAAGQALGIVFILLGMLIVTLPSSVLCSYCITQYSPIKSAAAQMFASERNNILQLLNTDFDVERDNLRSICPELMNQERALQVINACHFLEQSRDVSHEQEVLCEFLCERVLWCFYSSLQSKDFTTRVCRLVVSLNSLWHIYSEEISVNLGKQNHSPLADA